MIFNLADWSHATMSLNGEKIIKTFKCVQIYTPGRQLQSGFTHASSRWFWTFTVSSPFKSLASRGRRRPLWPVRGSKLRRTAALTKTHWHHISWFLCNFDWEQDQPLRPPGKVLKSSLLYTKSTAFEIWRSEKGEWTFNAGEKVEEFGTLSPSSVVVVEEQQQCEWRAASAWHDSSR